MKENLKHIVALLAFIVGAFVLSCVAVYSFWIGAFVFRSVAVVRAGDVAAKVILFPARMFLQSSSAGLEQMTLLTDPMLYAMINSALLGIVAYACCRNLIFRARGERGEDGK